MNRFYWGWGLVFKLLICWSSCPCYFIWGEKERSKKNVWLQNFLQILPEIVAQKNYLIICFLGLVRKILFFPQNRLKTVPKMAQISKNCLTKKLFNYLLFGHTHKDKDRLFPCRTYQSLEGRADRWKKRTVSSKAKRQETQKSSGIVETVILANGHFAWVTPAIFGIFVDFQGPRSKIPCFCR